MALRLAHNSVLKYGIIRNLLVHRELIVYNRNVNKLFIVGLKTGCITFSETNQNPDKRVKKKSTGKEIDILRENPYAGLSPGQKVKEASKDFTYLSISVAALGMLGALFYYIGRELFSSDSSVGVYSKALKECAHHSEVIIALGQPIKGYGEETRRGRRRHVSHIEFEQDGKKHMRMKFHVEGSDKKGEVNLEVVQNDSGKYEYRYLFVQLEQFPYRTIILEDNR